MAGGLSTALAAAQNNVAQSGRRARAPAGSTGIPVRDPRYADALGGSCIATDGLGLAQRASFAWFVGARFSQVDYAGNNIDECNYLLRQDLSRKPREEALPQGRWKLLWEGRRAVDTDERFRLYQKSGNGTTRGAGDAIDRNEGRDTLSPSGALLGPSPNVQSPAAGRAATRPADVPKKAP